MNLLKRMIHVLFVTTVICISVCRGGALIHGQTMKNSVTVDLNRDIGDINKKVFGNNLLGHVPSTYRRNAKPSYGNADYGAGIWDPKWKETVKEAIILAKEAGITVLRFPGGCGADYYNWKDTIGKTRKHYLFGIDEFMQVCNAVNAEAVFTVNYMNGDPSDATDLVKYMNGKYGVIYFEIGNEIWIGNRITGESISPEKYANGYLEYYNSMKNIDKNILVGAVLHGKKWNERVLNIIKDKLDFGIIHTYPTPIWGKKLNQMNPKDIFGISLGMPIFRDEINFQDTLKLLKEKSGKDIPLAITEYNGGFAQDEPVPYRHCLGTALLNAELLRIFMKPEHNILMANYWNFCNEYWGMIANGFNGSPKDLYNPYYKRPNYYVFEMYAKYFGDILIDSETASGYDLIEGTKIPYLSVNASKSKDGNNAYLMVINKNLENSITSNIELKNFIPSEEGNAWILNGPSVDATNEKKHDNVKIRHEKFRIKNNPFEFTFEPHSLTAIEITKDTNEN